MPAGGQTVDFGPFCLQRREARLVMRHDRQPVSLTPKAFDVLSYLAARPGELVRKKELLSALWPDSFVGDASIKVAVHEIRRALDDDADAPKFIETVHRRGYRFIADVHALPPAAPAAVPVLAVPLTPLVGRDAEMRLLMEQFADAAQTSRRRCVFVMGSAGGGKTALVDAFVARLSGVAEIKPLLVLMGHCFEQFGGGEAYLPLWEGLSRAAQDEPVLAALVARHAAVAPPSSASSPPRPADPTIDPGAAPAARRLLRDLVDTIESLAASRPVLFALEDAHWADHSTLDVLTALARRDGPARLMLLATSRPHDSVATGHPLREVIRELITARLAQEINLQLLDERSVAQYLSVRFGAESVIPDDFAVRLYQRTEGHPLFIVHLLDDLLLRGILTLEQGKLRLGNPHTLETHVPATVRTMIEAQLDRLEPGQLSVLQGAAIAGLEFSVAAVAAALNRSDVIKVEQSCQILARRDRMLEPAGAAEWRDGTVAARYHFVHELYHNVVYQRIGVAQLAELHRSLGMRLEAACGEHAVVEQSVAELAMHFEQARDWPRATRYLHAAGDAAARKYAHREAVQYLRRALASLHQLPPEQRREQELTLLLTLGPNVAAVRGWGDPELEQLYARAEELIASGQAPDDRETAFPMLWGIWVFHKVRSDLPRATGLAQRLLGLALQADRPQLIMQGHQAMCATALCRGELPVVIEHMERAVKIYRHERDAANAHWYGQDPGVATLAFGAVALCLLGRTKQAMAASKRALALAKQSAQPSTWAFAWHFTAMLHQLRGNVDGCVRYAQMSHALSEREGFKFWAAGATIFAGWAAAAYGREEGTTQIRRGIDDWLATGSRTYHPYYLGLLADALLRVDRAPAAMPAVELALETARSLREGLYESELLRLRERVAAALTA